MRHLVMTCLFLLAATTSFGQAVKTNPPSTGFNSKTANQQFDQINLQLSIQNLKLASLITAVETLTDLTLGADQCVESTQKN